MSGDARTVQLFGPETSKETAEAIKQRNIEGGKQHASQPLFSAAGKPKDRSGEYDYIVAKKANEAGMNIKPSGVQLPLRGDKQ
jgi:hypothetical protein